MCIHAAKTLLQSFSNGAGSRTIGRGDYLDQPLEINDDAMAALRYGIEGMRKAQKLSTVEGLEI